MHHDAAPDEEARRARGRGELTRFGVLGDVHCEDEALAAALAFLAERSLDAVSSVGDLVDGHGDAGRTLALLRDADVVADALGDPSVAIMVAGHTHERMVRRLEGLTVMNARTLHRAFAPGFVEVDLSARRVQAYDLTKEHAILAAETYPLELP